MAKYAAGEACVKAVDQAGRILDLQERVDLGSAQIAGKHDCVLAELGEGAG